MKKKRFASYLLTGKVAALPFLTNNSFADVTPTYLEVLSENVSVIELPVTGVRLMTTSTSAGAYSSYGGQGMYGGGTDAAICSSSMPSTMSVVVTGAHPGDTVYLIASTNKDDVFMQGLDSRIRIGSQNMSVISAFTLGNNPSVGDNPLTTFSQSTSPVSIPVNLAALQQNSLFSSNMFYLQAVIFPTMDRSTMWQNARFSEMDEIAVSSAGCPSTYGGSTYGGTT